MCELGFYYNLITCKTIFGYGTKFLWIFDNIEKIVSGVVKFICSVLHPPFPALFILPAFEYPTPQVGVRAI